MDKRAGYETIKLRARRWVDTALDRRRNVISAQILGLFSGLAAALGTNLLIVILTIETASTWYVLSLLLLSLVLLVLSWLLLTMSNHVAHLLNSPLVAAQQLVRDILLENPERHWSDAEVDSLQAELALEVREYIHKRYVKSKAVAYLLLLVAVFVVFITILFKGMGGVFPVTYQSSSDSTIQRTHFPPLQASE